MENKQSCPALATQRVWKQPFLERNTRTALQEKREVKQKQIQRAKLQQPKGSEEKESAHSRMPLQKAGCMWADGACCLPSVDLQFGRTRISSSLVNVGMERANPASSVWLKGNETENRAWKGRCCNVWHYILVQLPLNTSWPFAHHWQQHPEKKNPKIK